jgi:hypothetical protein
VQSQGFSLGVVSGELFIIILHVALVVHLHKIMSLVT